MAEGTVKWFDKKKGYGFVEYEGSTDIFTHYSGFADANLKTLDDGDTINFDIEEGEKGPRAINITLKSHSKDAPQDPAT